MNITNHFNENTYCQGFKFAGRELIDVNVIPYSLNLTKHHIMHQDRHDLK